MDARINKRGWLELKRAGKFKQQHCYSSQDDCACGDWCPLFVEGEANGKPYIFLHCAGGVGHVVVEDLRVQKESLHA